DPNPSSAGRVGTMASAGRGWAAPPGMPPSRAAVSLRTSSPWSLDAHVSTMTGRMLTSAVALAVRARMGAAAGEVPSPGGRAPGGGVGAAVGQGEGVGRAVADVLRAPGVQGRPPPARLPPAAVITPQVGGRAAGGAEERLDRRAGPPVLLLDVGADGRGPARA